MDNIKYYPDRFYIQLDDFDINNLTSFLTDLNLGQEQAVFIHEYYHYLTNITTFPGIRQFNLNFCDRFKLLTRLGHTAGLEAFPLIDNLRIDCKADIDYWNNIKNILDQDDIDYNLVGEVQNSIGKKFEILNIWKDEILEKWTIQGTEINGGRIRVKIDVGALVNRQSFELTYAALDEFLSSSIDEFLFQHDIADINSRLLSDRPYYPYRFFDDLLRYYGIDYPPALEKILIVYYALNSHNPPAALIELLEEMREGGYEVFQQNPEAYLLDRIKTPDTSSMLSYIRAFSNQCIEQGRIHIGQAIQYYGDRFYIAFKLKEEDFFYFIRPFLIQLDEKMRFKQKFLLALSRIIQVFTPPLILKDGSFKTVDKLTTMGEATMHIIALYEIFESLYTRQLAERPAYLNSKYKFPENGHDCEDVTRLTDPPIHGVFCIALNEVGLYRLYLNAARSS